MNNVTGRVLLLARAALVSALALSFSPHALAGEPEYAPADQGQRPASPRILPDDFLRGYDPITVYLAGDEGPGHGPADDGGRLLKIAPSWPGAWTWVDRRTLQFRPAEPWPALARFAVEAKGARKVLTTMMSAPTAMQPQSGADNLKPFRSFTLTFPQALPLQSLKQMLKLEVRELPGLSDSKKFPVKGFTVTGLPRASQRDPATYAVTFDEDIPEGKQLSVQVNLALGDEGKVLWSGKLSTRLPFHLMEIRCGNEYALVAGNRGATRDQALSCGNNGEVPQLGFSAPVSDLTLTSLRKLVRLEPAVPDLHFELNGARVALRGKFMPDVLYRIKLGASPVHDDSGRALEDPGEVEAYFFLGWKSAFLRWNQSSAILEANGPRLLPVTGYGDARADVRIYRVDPLYNGLWPFPGAPVVVTEEAAPPFPGEEPVTPKDPTEGVQPEELVKHIRLLGSPLVSKVVELPLAKKSGTTRFGLDLGPLLDSAVGKARPGTYLVGLRRLAGPAQRSYVRVQVTNLSLTSVDEQGKVVFFVRTLDKAEPVAGSRISIDIIRGRQATNGSWSAVPETLALVTDASGRATLSPQPNLKEIRRVTVQTGEDLLLIDPREPPPQFASNHWSFSSSWLRWLGEKIPTPPNEKTLAFLFTERPIYRPGEAVFLKGFVRRKEAGELRSPGDGSKYLFQVQGPGDQVWKFPVNFTALGGFDAKFQEKDPATGTYTATVSTREGQVLASRTFKIEAYRIPTFEVQLAAATAVRLDAPFKVKAVGRFYAGGFLAGQPVSWKVTRTPWHHVPEGRAGFLFADSTQFARPGAVRPPDTQSKTGNLDDSGADSMEVNPALDVDGSPRLYHFEATVTGPDDQQVTASQDVKALPPFLMGMKLTRYSNKPFDLKPEIIAVGVDDKLLAGQEISVRLYKRVWHSVLREAPFATGQAKYVTEQEDVKLLEKTVKTEDKPVVPTLPIGEAGVFVVELFARDKLGRVQTLSADLYVGGVGPVAWPKSREGVFELATDKKKYVPGDVARIVVQSPFQTGRALVIVEEPGASNSYTWHDVVGGKAVHELPIALKHVPNLPVHVVLMRGRLGEGASDDSRYRPQTLASSIELEVEPVKNSLKVGVAHPETARPGQKVDFTLTLADDQGKPLAGEVTFWLVDEAVLSLAKEATLDPLKSMIDRNARTTAIRDTRNLVIGKIVEQDEEPGGDGGDEEGTGGGKRIVRKDFRTVPFYEATVQIPATGKLVLPVKLSDDLTNFRVRAVAASGFSRFGLKQSVIRVRLPLLIQPQLPRFVRSGDKFWAGGVVRLLEGAEGPATVDLSIAGPVDAASAKAKGNASLKQNAVQRVLFPVTASASAGGTPAELKVTVGVTRTSDRAGDAFELKLPVLPDRTVEKFAWFDRWKEGKVAFKPFPEPPRPGSATQEVLVTSEPGILELAAGLSYLDAYPHGCLEQKMSQLYPHLAFVETFKKLGLEDRASGELPAVKRLLDEMPAQQDAQGLFSYWPGGSGDVALTAQAVEFLVAAKKAGVAVDPKLLDRSIEALKRVLRSDFKGLSADYRYNQQSAAVRALVRAGQADEHYLIDLYQHRADMDMTSLADLSLAMNANPGLFKVNIAALDSDLWGSVVTKLYKGQPIFDGLRWRRTGWGSGYLGSNTSSVAAVLESLVTLDPSDKRLALLRDGLISYSSATQGFGSTHDNRRAISALGLYLDKADLGGSKIQIALEGDGELSLEGAKKVARSSLKADAPRSATVKGGEVGARVSYSYLPAAPGDQAPALKEGLLVSRSMTVYKTDNSAPTHFDDKKGDTHKVAVGEILELHARLTSDQERYHVALVVPFAAGLEPLNPELQTSGAEAKPAESDSLSPTYVQRLDSEVRYYFTRLPSGTHSFHFRVRAVNQGSFVHPAPWAEMMYHQETRGRGEGMRIVVTGSQEK